MSERQPLPSARLRRPAMANRPLRRVFWRVVDALASLLTLTWLRILDAVAGGPLPSAPLSIPGADPCAATLLHVINTLLALLIDDCQAPSQRARTKGDWQCEPSR
jgi:hypothetical protein